jgi:hypothetical protein
MPLRLLSVLSLALLACGAKKIPGTDIRDTRDTRALVKVIEQYRQAAERRDAAAVMNLVSTTYFDDAGTPDPADDLDYQQLRGTLFNSYRQLSAIRLGIGVKEIAVTGNEATADIFYDGHWRIATPTGETPKQGNDISRMRFVREGGDWRIASGL